jgi:acetolactate synthase-1/2/3 large subunit
MERMTTAQAVVGTMRRNGIDTIYCLPGVQNDPFFDALYDNTNAIRPIHARHEQGCAYMALGAALASGKPQVYAVVPGPGFLNTTAALSTAYACNAPVLALSGQIPLASVGRNLGLLHELPDQLAIMRGLTKWSARIKGAAEAPGLVNDAFRMMRSGRQRPVGLECSMDTWARKATVAMPRDGATPEAIPVDEDAVEAAAKLLGNAKRPLIAVGGGALHAGEALRAIAEALQAPVMAVRMGHGALDCRHPLAINSLAGHKFWASADVVLAVGTRLQTQLANWGVDSDLKIVRIDADPEEIVRQRAPDVGIVGDSALVLKALADKLGKHNAKRADRTEEVREMKARVMAGIDGLRPQLDYLEAIRAALPEDGIFVDELTQVGYVARLAYQTYRPRTFITTGYQGTLGWGYATALGVKIAKPDTPVLSINGDGGFLFTANEMATAAQHNIPLVAVVFADGAYGNVKRIQQDQFNNRTIATDLKNPDFVKMAESFGVEGMRAHSPAELKTTIEKAFARKAPVLIEAPVGQMPDPWKHVALGRARKA